MSPIEYIEKGIRQGSWETICEGYERLTGKALPPPVTVDRTILRASHCEDAMQQIVDIAASVLNEPIVEICDKAAKPAKKKPGRPKGVSKKKARKKTTITKDGEDSSLQLDDDNRTVVQKNVGTTQLITNDLDQKEVEKNIKKADRARKNKLSLNRQAAKIYEVKCNECENPFQSNRLKGEMGQKCPKCLNDLRSKFS